MLSNTISHAHVKSAGILPVHSVTVSDHRAVYIDLDVKQLFSDVTIDTTKHTYWRFTTNNVKKCEIYLNQFTNLMGEARFFQKINEIKRDVQSFLMDLQVTGRYIGDKTEE